MKELEALYTPRSLYFHRNSPRYPLNRRLGGPQGGFEALQKKNKIPSLSWYSKHDPSVMKSTA
jgi:hypothetical protein